MNPEMKYNGVPTVSSGKMRAGTAYNDTTPCQQFQVYNDENDHFHRVSGCPWNRNVQLQVGQCSMLCNETWKQWIGVFMNNVYTEFYNYEEKRPITDRDRDNRQNRYLFLIAIFRDVPGIVWLGLEGMKTMTLIKQIGDKPKQEEQWDHFYSSDSVEQFTQKFVKWTHDEMFKSRSSADIYFLADSIIIRWLKGYGLTILERTLEGDFFKKKIKRISQDDSFYFVPQFGVYLARIEPEGHQAWEQKEAYRQDMATDPVTFQQHVGQQFEQAGMSVSDNSGAAYDQAMISRPDQNLVPVKKRKM